MSRTLTAHTKNGLFGISLRTANVPTSTHLRKTFNRLFHSDATFKDIKNRRFCFKQFSLKSYRFEEIKFDPKHRLSRFSLTEIPFVCIPEYVFLILQICFGGSTECPNLLRHRFITVVS